MKCVECKEELYNDAAFCVVCGAPVRHTNIGVTTRLAPLNTNMMTIANVPDVGWDTVYKRSDGTIWLGMGGGYHTQIKYDTNKEAWVFAGEKELYNPNELVEFNGIK